MSGRKRYTYDKRKFKTRLDELFAEVKATHTKSILSASLILQGEMRKTLSIPGTGRLYKATGITRKLSRKGTEARKKQMHRASSPGDPPAVDTGFLRASVVINPQPDGTVRVGPAAIYAPPLEHGTARMAARPFMQRSVDAAGDAMKEHIISELQTVFREAEKKA